MSSSTDTNEEIPGAGTLAYFEQLIDHTRPHLGTFKQRYWYNTMYYKGPGSPISFEAPSEAAIVGDATDFGSGSTITGYLAKEIGGAGIMLEHRFFGESTPVKHADYNAETLQPLTVTNAIRDLVYFAQNVKLPFDPKGLSHPSKAPWVMVGCSYAGALSAWTQTLEPGTFWAYQAGSAVVEAQDDFWQYFIPIDQAMPQNCSTDFRNIVNHVDETYINGTAEEKKKLKAALGHESVSDIESVEYLSEWLIYWQDHQFAAGPSPLCEICDYIENQQPGSSEPMPGAEGVGLEKALPGLVRGLKEKGYPTPAGAIETRSDSNAPEYAIDPWDWLLCNQPLQWWETDRPRSPFGLYSRLLNRENRISSLCGPIKDVGHFKYGLKEGRTAHTVNRFTGGWHENNYTRTVFVNADRDPWLYATVSSPDRDGGPLKSTDDVPVYMLRGAAHCNDYIPDNMHYNKDAKEMFEGLSKHMKKWVAEFYREKKIVQP